MCFASTDRENTHVFGNQLSFFDLLIIGALIYAGFFLIKFSSFRSQLFKAFENYGVQKDIANQIYSTQVDYINNLHHDGVPTKQIAKKILDEIDYFGTESDTKVNDPPVESTSPKVGPNATKTCPFCAEKIKLAAKKCKHCGEWLNSPQ